jgi:hypothetical protein
MRAAEGIRTILTDLKTHLDRGEGLTGADRAQWEHTLDDNVKQTVEMAIGLHNAELPNAVCREGVYAGFAPQVLVACEKAVALEPDNAWYRDGRGMALSVVGKREAALADFQYLMTSGLGKLNRETIVEREVWMKALRKGENPMNEGTLEELRRDRAEAQKSVDELRMAASAVPTLTPPETVKEPLSRAVEATTKALEPEWINDVCWLGSGYGFAKEVTSPCDLAVFLSPKNGAFRDSRGLAKALTGDYERAVHDFEFFVEWGENKRPESDLAERRKWIEALRRNENPFDLQTLAKLR